MYQVLEYNPQLQAYAEDIELRMRLYRETKHRILPSGGSLKGQRETFTKKRKFPSRFYLYSFQICSNLNLHSSAESNNL